jgi:triacylglycerol lipase
VMEPLSAYLNRRGWPHSHVEVLSFADPLGSSIAHADEIAAGLRRLQDRIGDASVCVVAHSMGGLALRWYLAHADASRISTAIFLATPHRGTWMAWLAREGAVEMRPSSRFLHELGMKRIPAHVRCVSFRAPWDTRVLPPASAWLDAAQGRLLPGRGHKRILRQPAVFAAIVDVILEDA